MNAFNHPPIAYHVEVLKNIDTDLPQNRDCWRTRKGGGCAWIYMALGGGTKLSLVCLPSDVMEVPRSPRVGYHAPACTSMHPRCNAHAPSQENVPWVLLPPLQGYLPKRTWKSWRQHFELISPRKLIMPMHPSLEFASDMDLSTSIKLVGIEERVVSYVVWIGCLIK